IVVAVSMSRKNDPVVVPVVDRCSSEGRCGSPAVKTVVTQSNQTLMNPAYSPPPSSVVQTKVTPINVVQTNVVPANVVQTVQTSVVPSNMVVSKPSVIVPTNPSITPSSV